MKTTSLWIIRFALAVQFIGVLAVPSLVAANDSPRGIWMAEWLRPMASERTIGVLRLRDGKLSFVAQVGQVEWELDLDSVEQVTAVSGPSTALRAGRAVSIVSVTGQEYVISILEPNMTLASPKKALAVIERAVQSVAAHSR